MAAKPRAMTVALSAAVLTAACISGGSVETAATETPTSSPSGSQEPSETAPGVVLPSGKPFEMYTHCGVENTLIRGVWWHAKPPLYNKRRNGPPAGWGDPYQTGMLIVESDDRAVFEAMGQQVVFVRASDNQPVRICD
jgi:hypothetical protein